jgi:hypothetical protein
MGQEVRKTAGAVGAFGSRFPEADDLLRRTEDSYTRLLASLVERSTPEDALARLDAISRRVDALRLRILDILSASANQNRDVAVDEAIDQYLGESGEILSARPKSMDVLHEHPLAGSLDKVAPNRLGESHASVWLHLAIFQPVLLLPETGEASVRDGVETVRVRFLGKLESPPAGFPTALPMAPTVAPDLTARYPRAAAIFDNLNLLRELVAELLVGGVPQTDPAIGDEIDHFLDPSEGITTHYQWVLMALRHGIFHQGGPALGTLDGNERNELGGHSGHAGH